MRDSSKVPLQKQQAELMPYLDKMKNCSYRNDSTHALLLQRIGALHFLQNDFVKGIEYTRQSIAIISENIGNPAVNREHLIKSYNNLRICYDALKKQNLKLEAIDSCIAIAVSLHAGYYYAVPLFYERIHNLIDAGDYYRCISYAIIAENAAKDYGYDLDQRSSYFIWRINALILLRRFAEAEELVTSKIDECRQAGATRTLGGLYSFFANILLEKGDKKKALLLYKKAFWYDSKIQNKGGCAGTLNNTGYLIYFKMLKEYDVALQYYYKALQFADGGESLNIYDNIANVYIERKLYDSGFHFFQKAFDQIKPGINETDLLQHTSDYVTNNISEYVTGLVLDKADAYLTYYRSGKQMSNLNEAIHIYKIIDRLFDKIKTGQSEIESKLFWRKHIRRLYENAIDACYLQNNIPDAFYFFEKSRAVLLNDQLNEQRLIGESDILKLAQLKRKIVEKERELGSPNTSPGQNTELQTTLFTDKHELDRLNNIIKANNPLYYQSFLDSGFITLKDVQKNILRDHQAMVEIFSGDSAVYSLVITAQQSRLTRIDKNTFDSTVRLFNSYISNADLLSNDYGGYVKTSHQLYQLIFQNNPVPAGRIIVSPDGRYFPFEALVTSSTNQPMNYFLDDHAVSYTHSARYLDNPFTANTNPSVRNFMGIAPVRYPASLHLPELNGSDRSLQQIGTYFSNTDMLLSSEASKKNFLNDFSKYKIVQLYTHASDSSSAGEPVIWFADSALYLSDLINTGKPGTNLIVLSACQTGSGKVYQGEGVFSFNRGFAALGIPSTITNLWSVDNLSTYKLTEIFYKYLAKGMPIDLALQKAKLEFIHSSRKNQLPYFWAATILAGKTEAIETKKAFSWKYPAIFFCLVVLFIWGLKGWVRTRKYLKKSKGEKLF